MQPILSLLVGFFLLFVIALNYFLARRRNGWPSGHPWSGLSLFLFAMVSLAWGFQLDNQFGSLLQTICLVAIVTAVAWICTEWPNFVQWLKNLLNKAPQQ